MDQDVWILWEPADWLKDDSYMNARTENYADVFLRAGSRLSLGFLKK